MVVGHYQFSPYFIFKELKILVNNFNIENEVQTIDIFENNIESLIHIDNYDDIIEKRNFLIKYIWKDNNFPKLESPLIENEILDQNYVDLSNLKKIEKISIPMKYDVTSVVYHFIAENSNNKLVIYHQGHSGNTVAKQCQQTGQRNHDDKKCRKHFDGTDTGRIPCLPCQHRASLVSAHGFHCHDPSV